MNKKSVFSLILTILCIFQCIGYSQSITNEQNATEYQTNGVFFVDGNVECHLISPPGETTNNLSAGKTYMIGSAISELHCARPTTIYFSNGLLIQTSSNSIFSISQFDQDVLNLNDTPSKAKFGAYNQVIEFINGDFSIICLNHDINSSLTIGSQYTLYDASVGEYSFKIGPNGAIVYVADGNLKQDGKNAVSKGWAVITFMDPLQDKTYSNNKLELKTLELEKIKNSLSILQNKENDILFSIFNKKVVGIWNK